MSNITIDSFKTLTGGLLWDSGVLRVAIVG